VNLQRLAGLTAFIESTQNHSVESDDTGDWSSQFIRWATAGPRWPSSRLNVTTSIQNCRRHLPAIFKK